MNRPIKFRAWDSNQEQMFEPSRNMVLESYDGQALWLFGFNEPRVMANLTLMQFTGLLDKNGREIYEGDIVEYEKAAANIRTFVKWSDERAGWIGVDYNPLSLEVIGNVCENPELLSPTKGK